SSVVPGRQQTPAAAVSEATDQAAAAAMAAPGWWHPPRTGPCGRYVEGGIATPHSARRYCPGGRGAGITFSAASWPGPCPAAAFQRCAPRHQAREAEISSNDQRLTPSRSFLLLRRLTGRSRHVFWYRVLIAVQ